DRLVQARSADVGQGQLLHGEEVFARARREGRGRLLEAVEALLEAPGVRLLGARERLEPLRDLVEAFLTGGLGEARIHLGVLVGLASDRSLEVLDAVADRLAGGRVAYALQVLEVPMGMTRLTLGGIAEQAGDVRLTFHVGLLGEVEVAAV